jgi:hypothetical protein
MATAIGTPLVELGDDFGVETVYAIMTAPCERFFGGRVVR